MTTSSATSTFVARNPTDLVALVPLVLGFHPADSVVLLTFGAPGGAFHARVDLPSALEEQAQVRDVLLGAVRANRVGRVAVLIYSDDVAAAESQGRCLLDALLGEDVEVIEVIRIEEDRWFVVPEDGSPGTAYSLETHPFTAQRVFEGQVVHRDRAELADTLVGTDEHDTALVAEAASRWVDLVAVDAAGLRSQARWLQGAVRRHLDGSTPSVEEAGRLLVLAGLIETRDVAWAEICRESAARHVELWRGLVRRAPRELLPGAASLLAFAAWLSGAGALAWCAVDRCLEVDPDYSMAHCVAETLTRAVPPSAWRQIREDELPVFEGGSRP